MKALSRVCAVVLVANLPPLSTQAQQCIFSGHGTPALFTANSYGALGDSADLVNDEFVPVIAASNYATPYVLELGVWVDEEFANATNDAPSVVLSYIDHLNCILGLGDKVDSTDDVHQVSFRIHEDRIKLSSTNTPNVAGYNGPWVQRMHAEWYDELQSKSAPTINILFTTRALVDLDYKTGAWGYIGGASNGVGQGQSIVHVDANRLVNGPDPHNEDWWGDIAAHELTHAMGRGGHTPRHYDVMCCSGPDYDNTQRFFTPSNEFSLRLESWDLVKANNDSTDDNWPDPYATTPNPETNETWDYHQISSFLTTFDQKARGDVFLAYSRVTDAGQGWHFRGHGWKVHDWFCIGNETCAVGDVNADGLDEIIAFGRGSAMKVYLAAMNGYVYQGTNFVVAENFCTDSQACKVADVNGDGAADLVAFTPTGPYRGSVYVMLNRGDGTGAFDGIVRRWHRWFCINDEQCEVGDLDGDNKADLVAFNHQGTVYVAYSKGNRFIGRGIKWHRNFCVGDQVCRLGDVNGDNKDDLIAFSRSAPGNVGDVWVSLTTRRRGQPFRPVRKWHDWFCINDEVCQVADVNGDGRADIIAFSRGSTGDVYVATAFFGSFLGQGVKWHEIFCINDETCLLADADGDGRKDILAFVK